MFRSQLYGLQVSSWPAIPDRSTILVGHFSHILGCLKIFLAQVWSGSFYIIWTYYTNLGYFSYICLVHTNIFHLLLCGLNPKQGVSTHGVKKKGKKGKVVQPPTVAKTKKKNQQPDMGRPLSNSIFLGEVLQRKVDPVEFGLLPASSDSGMNEYDPPIRRKKIFQKISNCFPGYFPTRRNKSKTHQDIPCRCNIQKQMSNLEL